MSEFVRTKIYRQRKVNGKRVEISNRRSGFMEWSDDYFIDYMKKNPQTWGRMLNCRVQNVSEGTWVVKNAMDEIEDYAIFSNNGQKKEKLAFLIKKTKNLKKAYYIESTFGK